MLTALDRLGVVGTRVIGASKDDLLKIARPPPADPVQAARGRRPARPGPQPADQLPVPQGGLRDRPRRLRQHLDPGRHQPRELPAAGQPTPELPIPDIPLPDLPPAGQVLNDVQKCLAAGDLTSAACQEGARRPRPAHLAEEEVPEGQVPANPVCRSLNALPDVPLDELGDAARWRARGHPRPVAGDLAAQRDAGRAALDPRALRRDVMIHGTRIRIAAFLVLSAVGHRLHHRLLPRLRRPGARSRASRCTRRCRPRAGSSRAARSPTAA